MKTKPEPIYCLFCKATIRHNDAAVIIPENIHVRQQWMHALKVEIEFAIPTNRSFLCRRHFKVEEQIRLIQSDGIFGHSFDFTLIQYGALPKNPHSRKITNQKWYKQEMTKLENANSGEPSRKMAKLTDQTSESKILPTVGWNHVPIIIFIDIFKLFIRNDIEKFQYIAKKWNDIIINNRRILPLRPIASLRMPNLNPRLLTMCFKESTQIIDIDEPIYPTLKSSIFEIMNFGQFVKNSNPYHQKLLLEKWRLKKFEDVPDEVDVLEGLVKALGEKIHVNKFIYAPVYTKDDETFLQNLDKVFNQLNVHTAKLEFQQETFTEILKNPSILAAKSLPKLVKLSYNSVNARVRDHMILAIDDVVDFFNKLPDKYRLYSIRFMEQAQSFTKDYLEYFLNTEAENFFNCIYIERATWSSADYLKSLRNAKEYKLEKGRRTYQCYEVSKDDWTFLYMEDKYVHQQRREGFRIKYKIFRK